MLTGSLLSGGVALAIWPAPVAARRLRIVFGGAQTTVWGGSSLRRFAVPAALALLVVVAVTGSLAVAVALGLFGGAARTYRRSRARTKAVVAETAGLGEAVRTMAGELRSGAHPAIAAEVAAADAAEGTADALRTVAATARLGGEISAALPPGPDGPLRLLSRAWGLAHEHGLPLAGVLHAVQRDLDAQVRMAGQVDARMAGARASAVILAVLPAAGIALGEAMGAGPVRVLTTTPSGQGLLVLGALLVLAGVRWSVALTGRVVLR